MIIKQNKGKELSKIPASKLLDKPYYYSTKLDGHYVQVLYDGIDKVRFFTSGGKEFYLTEMAEYIKQNINSKFYIECEYLYGCKGKLGDRGLSARLTTYRTSFQKCIKTTGHKGHDKFVVLDRLDLDDCFQGRLDNIQYLFDNLDWFVVPKQTLVDNLTAAKVLADSDVQNGYEGGMLKDPNHIYQAGKRTNDIIKLKPRKTADLLCIGCTEGEKKYTDMIGALVLEDSQGRQVSVGSGLTDDDRHCDPNYFIGNVIEIEYEQIIDTYIQPTFITMRLDKTKEDID